MRVFLFLSFLIFWSFFGFWSSAHAQSGDDVMDAYRAYSAALESGDERKALSYAQDAYEKAEEVWGDSREETALLATNYADELMRVGKWRRAGGVYERCAELLEKYEDSLERRLYCLLGAGDSNRYRGMERNNQGDYDKAAQFYQSAIELGEAAADPSKTIAGHIGESYLGLALLSRADDPIRFTPRETIYSGDSSSRIRPLAREGLQNADQHERFAARKLYALQAVQYLSEAYGDSTELIAGAYRVLGDLAADEGDYETALEYHKKIDAILRAGRPADDPLLLKSEGRLTLLEANIYYYSSRTEQREPGREFSGPECGFFYKDDLEIELCRELRIPPRFPLSKVYEGQQGFVLLKIDIAESGQVTNPEVVYSWPGGVFDERTLSVAEGWRYKPPTDQFGNVHSVSGHEIWVRFVIQ